MSAVCAGLATLIIVGTFAPPRQASVRAYVSSRPLPAGHVLTAADFTPIELPVNGSPAPEPSTLIGPEAQGQSLAIPWPAGLPLHSGAMAGSALLKSVQPGEVAVPLTWRDGASAAMVQAGDVVDVVVSSAQDGEEAKTSTLARDARVVWVSGAQTGSSPDGAWLSSPDSSGTTVVLAVPRTLGAELSSAPQRGAVSLVLTG